jgi:hypothetical protein
VHRGLEKKVEEKENIQWVWSASARKDESKKWLAYAPNVRGRESKFLVEKP